MPDTRAMATRGGQARGKSASETKRGRRAAGKEEKPAAREAKGAARAAFDPSATASDRATWRRWLDRHHRKAAEVWLIFARKHTGKPCVTYDEAVEEALCYGWIDGIKKTVDEDHYTYRFTPRRPGSAWSPINRKRAEQLIEAGRMTPTGLAAVAEARQTGAWSRSQIKRPDHMSSLLKEVLATNPSARAAFEALPPSHQRQWNLWVNEAVKEETRTRRAQEVAVRVLARRRPGM